MKKLMVCAMLLIFFSMVFPGPKAMADHGFSSQASPRPGSTSANPSGWLSYHLVAKLVASDYADWHSFGWSMDIDGNYLIAGDLATLGSIYIFKRVEGTDIWNEIKKIPNPREDVGGFGWSVAINGTTVVVGSFRRVAWDDYVGTAFVYEKDYGGVDNWGLVKELAPPGMPLSYAFGHAVDINGDTIIVGAFLDSTQCYRCGSAWIFERNFGGEHNWGLSKELFDPASTETDFFGSHVSLFQDTLFISSPNRDVYDPNDLFGAVFVYYRDLGGDDYWGNLKILAPLKTNLLYRQSMKLKGDTAIIVTVFDGVSIFGRDVGGSDYWGEVGNISVDYPSGDFGASIDMVDDRVIIGEPESRVPYDFTGAAYFYIPDPQIPGDWYLLEKMQSPDGEDFSFGNTVYLTNDEIYIASYGAVTNGEFAGAIYIYRYQISPPTFLPLVTK